MTSLQFFLVYLYCSYRMSLAAPVAERDSLPGNIVTTERGQAAATLAPSGSGKAGESADRTRDQSHGHQR